MNIEIHSAKSAARELYLNDGKWHVISLRTPPQHDGRPHPVQNVQRNAKAMIVRQFDDVWKAKHERSGFILPTKEDVQACLDFVTNQQPENLLVHCDAGVSRSSAMAYVIACTMRPPQEALNLLNPMLHMPNERIVKYGSEILENDDVWLAFKKDFGDDLFASLMGDVE